MFTKLQAVRFQLQHIPIRSFKKDLFDSILKNKVHDSKDLIQKQLCTMGTVNRQVVSMSGSDYCKLTKSAKINIKPLYVGKFTLSKKESNNVFELNGIASSSKMTSKFASITKEDYDMLINESSIDPKELGSTVYTDHSYKVYPSDVIDRKFMWIKIFVSVGFVVGFSVINELYNNQHHIRYKHRILKKRFNIAGVP